MKRFDRVAEPAGFAEARTKGQTWLSSHSTGRPRDYWSPYKADLAAGFHSLCGYSAMYEPVGTVDHFVSCTENRDLAYEWSNYRYAAPWLNSSKADLRSVDVLDPHEVEDDWFELLLPSLQLVATDAVPVEQRHRVELMLTRLHLGNDERIMRQRQAWLRLYEDGHLDLEGLARVAPLIARAVVKRG